jgi:hypothetical protein
MFYRHTLVTTMSVWSSYHKITSCNVVKTNDIICHLNAWWHGLSNMTLPPADLEISQLQALDSNMGQTCTHEHQQDDSEWMLNSFVWRWLAQNGMELKVAAVTYKKMASESCEVTMAAGMKWKSAISSLPFSGGTPRSFKFLHLLSLSSLFNRGGDSMQADT